MKFGININVIKLRYNNIFITVYLPFVKVGLFTNTPEEGDIWTGINFQLKTELSFEKYDYGKIFTAVLLGFGISITKTL